MMQQVSIRFYSDREARAVWDEAAAKWWFPVIDCNKLRKTGEAFVFEVRFEG